MHQWLLPLALILLLAVPAPAREAGWVPLAKDPWQPPVKSRVPEKRKPAVPKKVEPKGATVYDRQKPVGEGELADFIVLLPEFRSWAARKNEEAHPIVNERGQPDFLYSSNAAQWVANHGFTPARFFCIMGKMAASLVIIEEGNERSKPRDMPSVDPAEVALARRHLGELLTAGSVPVTIK